MNALSFLYNLFTSPWGTILIALVCFIVVYVCLRQMHNTKGYQDYDARRRKMLDKANKGYASNNKLIKLKEDFLKTSDGRKYHKCNVIGVVSVLTGFIIIVLMGVLNRYFEAQYNVQRPNPEYAVSRQVPVKSFAFIGSRDNPMQVYSDKTKFVVIKPQSGKTYHLATKTINTYVHVHSKLVYKKHVPYKAQFYVIKTRDKYKNFRFAYPRYYVKLTHYHLVRNMIN